MLKQTLMLMQAPLCCSTVLAELIELHTAETSMRHRNDPLYCNGVLHLSRYCV